MKELFTALRATCKADRPFALLLACVAVEYVIWACWQLNR